MLNICYVFFSGVLRHMYTQLLQDAPWMLLGSAVAMRKFYTRAIISFISLAILMFWLLIKYFILSFLFNHTKCAICLINLKLLDRNSHYIFLQYNIT